MSYLFFVRHGQGTLDGGHYDQLSELGRVQSRMLGEVWAARDFKIDHVYSGTQKRHRQTAETVAASYETNGLKFPEITKDERFNEIVNAWINERIPDFDGMSWKEYCRLVLDASSELGKYDRGDRIVIFTSGNPIGIYVKEALGISDAKALELVGNL
ncbi:MAG: histidine phosphatase family protein, partial [Deltaproteobacteria bacterium]|nr:histidine phosphatase family protein [Deltaproteobacteria bacterium]